jgi:hypothetical protein
MARMPGVLGRPLSHMARNEAPWDRGLRLALVAVLVLVAASRALAPPWELALVVLSFYPLVTGLSGWDPIYVLLGFRGTRGAGDG